MTNTLTSASTNDVSAKELPLIDDIRLLGQVLGDTIREQEGEETFKLIETIRKLSIAFEREADPDTGRQPHTSEDGSFAATFARLAKAGLGKDVVADKLGGSLVSPVLTAHPTEVQRKSQRDAERSIAQLLLERDTLPAAACPDRATLANAALALFALERS